MSLTEPLISPKSHSISIVAFEMVTIEIKKKFTMKIICNISRELFVSDCYNDCEKKKLGVQSSS